MKFFIAALPRTRTAWLANFFTYRDSFCFHELKKLGKDMYAMRDILQSRREGTVGTADCSLPFYYENVCQVVPHNKLAIIESEPDKVVESLYNLFGENEKFVDIVNKSQTKLNELKHKYNPFVMNVKELDDPKRVEQLWYHLVPNIEFDLQRYNMLNELNIEINKTKYMSNLKVSNLDDIVGELSKCQ